VKDAFGVSKSFIPTLKTAARFSPDKNFTAQGNLQAFKKEKPDEFKAHLAGIRHNTNVRKDPISNWDVDKYKQPITNIRGSSRSQLRGVKPTYNKAPYTGSLRVDGAEKEVGTALKGMTPKALKRVKSRKIAVEKAPLGRAGVSGLHENKPLGSKITLGSDAARPERTVAHELGHAVGQKNHKRSWIRSQQMSGNPGKLGREEARVDHLTAKFPGESSYGAKSHASSKGEDARVSYFKDSPEKSKSFLEAYGKSRKNMHDKKVPQWKYDK
jgi:hypothetical protein